MKPECKTYPNGTKRWTLNGLLHREEGPAIILYDGTKAWYLNNKCHREDGPAVEWFNGCNEWHYHGKRITCKNNQEFLRMIKLKMFL
tara:strand:+ start:856 stop:1116 length:261 start_codon:yes stop_codon:yes gene_type:complete